MKELIAEVDGDLPDFDLGELTSEPASFCAILSGSCAEPIWARQNADAS
ncbi:hypothetical protein [Sulfitobacter faviae]|nr:hypothetical protein [Sulfitobacter faviae]